MRLLGICLISVMLTSCVGTDAEEGNPKRGFGLLGDFATPPPSTPLYRTDRHTATMLGFSDVAVDAPRSGPKAQSLDVAADASEGAPVTLNFDNAELQEFVRVVFDEVLKQNVIVDPALTGRVTLRTSHPIPRAEALKLVREVLRSHGATLVVDAGVSKVVASGQASGNADRRIVRLRYLDPAQARAALQPFTTNGVQVSANVAGRFLAMSGPAADIRSLEDVIGSLDVDQMRGRSIALVPLREAAAASVAREIQSMFGPDSGRAFQAMPIDRMNAVMVMADQASTIARARRWIAHLDQSDRDKARMFVYPVQNRRATELAGVLNGMFATKALENKEQAVAPSFTAAKTDTISSPKPNDISQQPQPYGDLTPQADTPSPPLKKGYDEVRIKADVATNSVVVYALPEEYTRIERAMRNLDLPPAQVLIEATIAEVTLNDALKYGVRWYFQNQHNSVGLISGDAAGGTAATPGFNYSFSVANAQVALNLLEQMTKVEVVSSPALTVLNNQTATLQVGDQVPITTQSSQGTAIAGAPVINSIQMKDTGIILNVTPRVNAGGMMVLDINQEVSSVVPTTTSNIDSPTIRQRRITSSVTIGNGMELVLGGLIQKETDLTKDGVPVLSTIPLIGNAFTSKKNTTSARTELLILIRPTILTGKADWVGVTREIKDRLSDASTAMHH